MSILPASPEPLGKGDQARSRTGQPAMIAVFFAAYVVASQLYLVPAFRTADHLDTTSDPAPAPWFGALLLRILLTEGVVVLLVIGVFGGAQVVIGRRTGTIVAGGTGRAVRSVAAGAAFLFISSVVLGLGVFSLLGLPAGAVWALAFAVLHAMALQWLTLPVLKRRLPLRPAPDGLQWVQRVRHHAHGSTADYWQCRIADISTNIAISGAVRGRRAFLAGTDTIEDMQPAEVDALAAHAAGHLVQGHFRRAQLHAVLRRVAAAGCGLLMVNGVAGWEHRTDPRAYVVFGASAAVASFVGTAIAARRLAVYEAEADRFALRATRDPDAFERMVTTCTRANATAVTGSATAGGCGPLPAQHRLALAATWRAEHPEAAPAREVPGAE